MNERISLTHSGYLTRVLGGARRLRVIGVLQFVVVVQPTLLLVQPLDLALRLRGVKGHRNEAAQTNAEGVDEQD